MFGSGLGMVPPGGGLGMVPPASTTVGVVPPSAPSGFATAPGGMGGYGGSPGGSYEVTDWSQEGLVAKVKELQRADVHAREQWQAFADVHGKGVKDPTRHEAQFLQEYISHLTSGARLEVGQDQDLTIAIKALQKRSTNVKQFWAQYCLMAGGGRNDPAKHDGAYHVKFFDTLAQAALNAGGLEAGMGAGDPHAKRMRDASGMAVGMPMGGGSGKDALVNQVKAFQRSSEQAKELWATYADTYLHGMRDPSRHDEATLQEFCQNHNVPQVSAGTPAGPGGLPFNYGLVPGSHKEALVNQIKSFQRSSTPAKELWETYADSYLGGRRNPAKHEESTLQEFITNHNVPQAEAPASHMAGGPTDFDPAKAQWVDKVKNYQRSSPEAKEAWSQFAGMTKDPNRHTSEKLMEFCSMYGIY